MEKISRKKGALLGSIGLALGFVNGYMGSGGGVLTVLVLLYVLRLPARQAHATAILVILPLCAASSAVYFLNNSTELTLALFATVGVTLGGVVGALLLNKLKNKAVTLIFAALLIAAAIRMFIA